MKVALVVLDALRKDSFDEKFSYVTGRKFENAWSTSHWTVPAHGSLFTGLYPSEHGSTAKQIKLVFAGTTLAEHLRAEGIKTHGISANGNVSPLTDFDRGFDTFQVEEGAPRGEIVDWSNFDPKSEGGWLPRYLSALRTAFSSEYDTIKSLKYSLHLKFGPDFEPGSTLHAEGILDAVEEMEFEPDSFLFLNLMDAHQVFEPPEPYQSIPYHSMTIADQLSALALGNDEPPEADGFKTGYEDSVDYLTDVFSTLYGFLSDEFDHVIVLSDHGDALGEAGVWGHVPSLQPEITRIPLVISGTKSETVERPVSIKDIPATVADLFAVDPFPHGVSLLSDAVADTVVTEAHGLQKYQRDKLVERGIGQREIAAIDQVLRGIATANQYGFESPHDGWKEVDSDGQIRERLEEFLTELDQTEFREAEVSVDVRERLERMGYL